MQRRPVTQREPAALRVSDPWALELAGPAPRTAVQHDQVIVLVHAERHVVDPSDGQLPGSVNEDVLSRDRRSGQGEESIRECRGEASTPDGQEPFVGVDRLDLPVRSLDTDTFSGDWSVWYRSQAGSIPCVVPWSSEIWAKLDAWNMIRE